MEHWVVLESQRKHSLINNGIENYVKRQTYYDNYSYPPVQEYVLYQLLSYELCILPHSTFTDFKWLN